MRKNFLVFGDKRNKAKFIARLWGVPTDACILIDDEEHAKDLIKNSYDLIQLRYDPAKQYDLKKICIINYAQSHKV